MSLGAYVLGGLDFEDCALVEAHLATCPGCHAESEELRELTTLLDRVSEADIRQAASRPHAVLDRLVAVSAKRRRAYRVVLGLAASVVAVALGGTAWLVAGQSERVEVTAAGAPAATTATGSTAQGGLGKLRDDSTGGHSLTATPGAGPSTPQGNQENTVPAEPGPAAKSPGQAGSFVPKVARGTIELTGKNGSVGGKLRLIPGGEGTTVEVAVSGVPDGTSCRMTAIGEDGTESPAGSWTVDAAGYEGGPATFTGHTELMLHRIKAFDIRTSTGRRLLLIEKT